MGLDVFACFGRDAAKGIEISMILGDKVVDSMVWEVVIEGSSDCLIDLRKAGGDIGIVVGEASINIIHRARTANVADLSVELVDLNVVNGIVGIKFRLESENHVKGTVEG